MTRLRVPLDDLRPGPRGLDRDTAQYVCRVHRLAAGDRFVAFDPRARLEADATLLSSDEVMLSAPRAATHVATRPVTLIQALAKGSKVADIVRDATELGATRIVVAVADRSVKRGADPERWQRVAVEAARQCGRGDVPVIDPADSLAEALARGRDPDASLVLLDPRADRELADVATRHAVVLVVGPEGGFSDDERAAAGALGYVGATLGAFTLRTETACAAALGALAAIARAKPSPL